MLNQSTLDLPRAMANAIRPLYSAPTRIRYARYLQEMAHYTRFAGAELERARDLTQDPQLRQLFSGLASEEESHHRLADADLHGLGIARTADPSAAVVAYRVFWNAIDAGHAWRFAGALYALENVARYAGPEALVALAPLGLQPYETRFVRAHLTADDAHGDRVRRCCERGFGLHADDIAVGARIASECWISIHLAALAPAAAAQPQV
jgi:Iron-containing redox enzyme